MSWSESVPDLPADTAQGPRVRVPLYRIDGKASGRSVSVPLVILPQPAAAALPFWFIVLLFASITPAMVFVAIASTAYVAGGSARAVTSTRTAGGGLAFSGDALQRGAAATKIMDRMPLRGPLP